MIEIYSVQHYIGLSWQSRDSLQDGRVQSWLVTASNYNQLMVGWSVQGAQSQSSPHCYQLTSPPPSRTGQSWPDRTGSPSCPLSEVYFVSSCGSVEPVDCPALLECCGWITARQRGARCVEHIGLTLGWDSQSLSELSGRLWSPGTQPGQVRYSDVLIVTTAGLLSRKCFLIHITDHHGPHITLSGSTDWPAGFLWRLWVLLEGLIWQDCRL